LRLQTNIRGVMRTEVMLNKATKLFDQLAALTIAGYCLSFITAKFIFNPGGFPIAYFVFSPSTRVNAYCFGYTVNFHALP
jgi:hypothetical protein